MNRAAGMESTPERKERMRRFQEEPDQEKNGAERKT